MALTFSTLLVIGRLSDPLEEVLICHMRESHGSMALLGRLTSPVHDAIKVSMAVPDPGPSGRRVAMIKSWRKEETERPMAVPRLSLCILQIGGIDHTRMYPSGTVHTVHVPCTQHNNSALNRCTMDLISGQGGPNSVKRMPRLEGTARKATYIHRGGLRR